MTGSVKVEVSREKLTEFRLALSVVYWLIHDLALHNIGFRLSCAGPKLLIVAPENITLANNPIVPFSYCLKSHFVLRKKVNAPPCESSEAGIGFKY